MEVNNWEKDKQEIKLLSSHFELKGHNQMQQLFKIQETNINMVMKISWVESIINT